MNIPKITSLVQHQNIHPLLECDTPYNEDIVRAFYAGLQKGEGCYFRFKMGSHSHLVDKKVWASIFSLTFEGDEFRIEDCDVPANFDHLAYMRSILKDP